MASKLIGDQGCDIFNLYKGTGGRLVSLKDFCRNLMISFPIRSELKIKGILSRSVTGFLMIPGQLALVAILIGFFDQQSDFPLSFRVDPNLDIGVGFNPDGSTCGIITETNLSTFFMTTSFQLEVLKR